MHPRKLRILLVAIVTQAVAIGLSYGILPVLLEPIETAFDAPRTLVSSGQIVIMLSLALGGIVTGTVLDRGHAKAPMLAGAVCFAAALALASVASSLLVLGLAAALIGFSIPAIGPLTGACLIRRYFDTDRGRALGLMAIGPPLGGGLFVLLAGWLLESLDWRAVLRLASIVAIVVVGPLVAFVVPARLPPDPTPPANVTARAASDEPGASPAASAALRSGVFWWSALCFALMVGVSQGWSLHVVAFLGGIGIDELRGAQLVALQNVIGVPAALALGAMADRVGVTPLLLAMLLSVGAGFAAFATEPAMPVAVLLCAVFGIAFGGVLPVYMVLLGERLPADALGRAMGFSNLVMLPVQAVSVLGASWAYETWGDYRLALAAFAATMLAAIACLFASNRSFAASRRTGTMDIDGGRVSV